MMMAMVTFTPNVVVMIIVVIIAMMSDIPMGPSLVRLSVSQEAICLIPASSHWAKTATMKSKVQCCELSIDRNVVQWYSGAVWVVSLGVKATADSPVVILPNFAN